MAPKKKKELVDERFQAVVLTDSYETRFMPLTAVRPRCLLPLANVPLIEYTLEFLARAGVNEVFLMCSSHADQVQQYIEQSKWTSSNLPFTIKPVILVESRSVGDAMRDLDNRGVILGDFLLVSGDVVTNIDFDRAMAAHRRHRDADANHILTMVLAAAAANHRARTDLDPATFVLDAQTSRCVYYQGIGTTDSIRIDPELVDDVAELVVRNDLIDCHVDICSPLVPQLFQDNFDYQLLRTDFVRGVLNSDIAKKTLYAYVTDEYAARVVSWATYNGISQDVLERWSYPLVPDANLLEDTAYAYEAGHIYKDRQVALARLSQLLSCTCVGSSTSVGAGSVIGNSIVGSNCTIGAGVRMSSLYVWDKVAIGDNTCIEGAIVAAGARIGSNVTIKSGCVVGYGVVVGDGVTLEPHTRLVEQPVSRDTSFGDDGDAAPAEASAARGDETLVGAGGRGFAYDSDSDSLADSLADDMAHLELSDSSVASISASRRRKAKSRRMSLTSAVSTDAPSEDEEDVFAREAFDTIQRSMENNHDIDTTLLEINSLRMSMNVSYHQVRMATVKALATRIVHFITTDTLAPKEATQKTLAKWGPLFRRQVFDADDQVDLLQLVQQQCASADPSYNQTVLFVAASWLYDEDYVDEEQVYAWWELPQATASAELELVRQVTGRWVEWLREAEEESD